MEALAASRESLEASVRSRTAEMYHELIERERVEKALREKEGFFEVSFDLDTLVPLGLIINELMTNALKHAFEGSGRHLVRIGLALAPEGYELEFSDNGRGLPEDFDIKNSRTLGLKLVSSLAAQLEGSLSVERRGGARYTIAFAPTPVVKPEFALL